MSRIARRTLAVGLIASGALALGASAQPLIQGNVSVKMARQMIEAAIASCSQPGDLVTVSVAVVDRAGQPVMQVRGDTASPHNWELAYRKAFTARTYRRPSIEWRDQTAGDSINYGQRLLADVIPLGGGVPVMMHGDTIGAVGVSGAQGGQPADNACAEAAVAAVADQLQ
jgi:uncharacterized protein GlcG (DUF336 family)